MDAAGVDVQVLSFGQPGPQGFAADVAIPMARDANDRLADAVAKHPDRFAGFAALPTPDPEAAARASSKARRQEELGFKGAMIHGHTQGVFLDDKKFWAIFRDRGEARRPDLPASGDAAPGRRQSLLRAL